MRRLLAFIVGLTASLTIAMADDDMIWGYYTGGIEDLIENSGTCTFGAEKSGTFRVAMYVPGDGILKGGSITGLRIPIWKASVVKNITAWVSTSSNPDNHAVEAKLKTPVNASYNEVVFDKAIRIPAGGAMVGMNFTISSASTAEGKFPIFYDGISGNHYTGSFYFYYQQNWYNCDNYGPLAFQVKIKGVSQAAGAVAFNPLEESITVANETSEYTASLRSDGFEDVKNITYTVDVAGVTETRDYAIAIQGGFNRTATMPISITAPAKAAKYDVKLAVTKVNGKDNSIASNIAKSTFVNVSRREQRNTVMEEFTGTEVEYAPRAMVGMEKLRNLYGDRFVGISLHQFNMDVTTDAMEFENWRELGLTSSPSSIIDGRGIGIDPFYGTDTDITKDFEHYNSFAPQVVVNAKAEWVDDNMKQVSVKADIESLSDGNYSVLYALTADKLHGTTSDWAQENFYADATPDKVDPELRKYSQGGEYGSAMIYPYYNDVLIASSFSADKVNLAEGLGTMADGTTATSSYVLDMPSETTSVGVAASQSAADENIYAIVMVVDEKGAVANAQRVLVTAKAAEKLYVTTSDKGYSTFYDSKGAYEIPEGFVAMVATMADGNTIKYDTIAGGNAGTRVIPAATPVLLSSGVKLAKRYALTLSKENVQYKGENLLCGSDKQTVTTGPANSVFYKLTYSNDKSAFGWYWGAADGGAFLINGHKAWLAIPTALTASPRGFAIDGVVDGIETISAARTFNGPVYNIAGQAVDKSYDGIVIENGKKVVKQ